jgi:hypothetical protein
MPRETRKEERLTEDEIARRKLGPRGVPGGPDTSKMTPQQEKNIFRKSEFDGHTGLVGQNFIGSLATSLLLHLNQSYATRPTHPGA